MRWASGSAKETVAPLVNMLSSMVRVILVALGAAASAGLAILPAGRKIRRTVERLNVSFSSLASLSRKWRSRSEERRVGKEC